jgi:hypothetical protein
VREHGLYVIILCCLVLRISLKGFVALFFVKERVENGEGERDADREREEKWEN